MAESSFSGLEFAAATRRMQRSMWLLAALGAVAFSIAKGTAWGLSFLVGALLSIASFRHTQRFVNAIGPNPGEAPSMAKAVLVGLRYLLIGGLVYVLMTTAGLSVLGALLGLLIAAAAVLAEMLYQLLLLRKSQNQ